MDFANRRSISIVPVKVSWSGIAVKSRRYRTGVATSAGRRNFGGGRESSAQARAPPSSARRCRRPKAEASPLRSLADVCPRKDIRLIQERSKLYTFPISPRLGAVLIDPRSTPAGAADGQFEFDWFSAVCPLAVITAAGLQCGCELNAQWGKKKELEANSIESCSILSVNENPSLAPAPSPSMTETKTRCRMEVLGYLPRVPPVRG